MMLKYIAMIYVCVCLCTTAIYLAYCMGHWVLNQLITLGRSPTSPARKRRALGFRSYPLLRGPAF